MKFNASLSLIFVVALVGFIGIIAWSPKALSKQEDYAIESIVRLNKRVLIQNSNPPQWTTEPLYVKLEDIISMTPAGGANVGHTTVTISNGPSRSSYSVVIIGNINGNLDKWIEISGRKYEQF